MNLTGRQQEVLAWVKQGMSNKHIAKRLNIGESTVKQHVGALLQKHGVRSRTQLIAFSRQDEIVELPTDIEPLPQGWVKRSGKTVKGIVFTSKQPDPSWEQIYIKAKERT